MNDDWLLRSAIDLISEKKGKNIIVIDLRNSPIPTDYFVIAEGENLVHVKAIVSNLMSELPLKAIHREGLSERRWVVLDYGEFMVHVFVKEAREFYDIESLWADHIVATEGSNT
jgi:ribosome-associated protein